MRTDIALDTEAICTQGIAGLKSGDFTEACRLFRTVIDQDTRHVLAWLGLAEGLSALGDGERALRANVTAFLFSPDLDSQAATMLASRIIRQPDTTLISNVLIEALKDQVVAAQIAYHLSMQSQFKRAADPTAHLAILRAAKQLAPENAEYRHAFLELCRLHSRYQEIVDILTALPEGETTPRERQLLTLAQDSLPDYLKRKAAIKHTRTALADGDLATAAHSVVTSLIHQRRNYARLYFDSHRHSRYLDYPAFVHLESLAACNAACGFCPYPTMERQGTRMPDALLDKILTELEAIPKDLPFKLAPFKVSDPFIEKRLFDIIGRAEQRLPSATIALISNGSTIAPQHLDRLARTRNVDYLSLSLNECRPDRYEALMKLPFARTIDKLKLIHERHATNPLPFKIHVSRVIDGSPADFEFSDFIKREFPAFGYLPIPTNDWIGQVDIETSNQQVTDVPCNRWFMLSITATGTVALCCMDGNEQWPIGNVNEQHVLDVYNSPSYRALRAGNGSRREARSPCNGCTYE